MNFVNKNNRQGIDSEDSNLGSFSFSACRMEAIPHRQLRVTIRIAESPVIQIFYSTLSVSPYSNAFSDENQVVFFSIVRHDSRSSFEFLTRYPR